MTTTTAEQRLPRLERADAWARLAEGGGPSLTVSSPWASGDDAVLGEVATTPAARIGAIVESAREAQREWAEVPVRARAAILRRVGALARERREALMDVVQLESGKNRLSAFEEVMDVALNAAYYARAGRAALKPRRHAGATPMLTSTAEHHRPKGVVGIITPWNYPLTLAVSDALPALMAGNAVVLKPDSRTPLTALAGLELLRDAGLPAGLMRVIVGAGSEIGPPLVGAVDYLMFTGSTATGRALAGACGERLIGCSMELGGKNPMLVLADADVERAAAGAVRACFSNSGQLCVSIERIYVADEVHDAFVAAFVRRVQAMSLGAGLDWDIDMGSLASRQQLDAVDAHVTAAVAKGATVLAGGRARPDLGPCMYEPTVLADVTEDMRLAREETFGPVVSVYRVGSDEEAIARANDSSYGLNASVWSARRGSEAAARVQAGTVNVNEGYAAAWGSTGAPMGGWKDSGLGRRHGVEGILKYTEAQTIAVQRGVGIAPVGSMAAARYAVVMNAAVGLVARMPRRR